VQLICSGGMSTNLHVERQFTIKYHSCGGDLQHVKFWIITVVLQSRIFLVFCDLNDCTSHILAVYSFSADCVVLTSLKVKVSLTSHQGCDREWNVWRSPLL